MLTNGSEEVAASTDAIVAKVNCDNADNRPLCDRQGVKGFPTIKLFTKGETHLYRGDRSAAAFSAFVADPTTQPQPAPAQPLPPSAKITIPGTVELTTASFGPRTASGVWLVFFHIGSRFDREAAAVFEQALRTVTAAGLAVRGAVVDAIAGASIAEEYELTRFPAVLACVPRRVPRLCLVADSGIACRAPSSC
jgi:hypothetical protein